ncbi:GntR family transcriptional regulator [Rhodoplanes roseus]|uniref:HTH gntR-type domain-containing protein n=1 Tax=Rhodoplanes roseus TaxID=29409 RepID=A0A327L4V5_9BRAD|nr:GntR family transcriptional regulator [Rhodoplanes roseus]RAI44873.1 hypothetical protein CH341_06895 [Rhodoplanes roseus]
MLPGERLVEATLAKRMGVSRPSIREAPTQLAAEKLVTITPNKGPSVAAITWSDAQDIYHVRARRANRCAASRHVQAAATAARESLDGLSDRLRGLQAG